MGILTSPKLMEPLHMDRVSTSRWGVWFSFDFSVFVFSCDLAIGCPCSIFQWSVPGVVAPVFPLVLGLPVLFSVLGGVPVDEKLPLMEELVFEPGVPVVGLPVPFTAEGTGLLVPVVSEFPVAPVFRV